jgi:hypothetical protein
MKLGLLLRGEGMKKAKKSILKLIIGLEITIPLLAGAGFVFWLLYSTSPASIPTNSPIVTEVLSITANPIGMSPPAKQIEVLPMVDFSLSSVNTTLPENILAEITFYGGGGGLPLSAFNKPAIYSDVGDEELMTLNTLVICGLSSGQTLIGKVLYPDGRIFTDDIQALPDNEGGGKYFAKFSFKPQINDPVGLYVFSLDGVDGKFETNAYYRKPDGPRLFKIDNTHILFYGFTPQENVKLYYYKHIAEKPDPIRWWQFVGWKEFKTDNIGQLVVLVSIGQGDGEFDSNEGRFVWSSTFVAVGETTGEVPLLHNPPFGGTGISMLDESISGQEQKKDYLYLKCSTEKLSQSHLKAGDHAVGIKSVNFYSNPRIDARQVDWIPDNSEISLELGPFCAGSQIWWRATADIEKGFSEGYVLEKDGDIYLLEPKP